MESWAAMRPSAVAFSTSFLVMVECTQLVVEFLAMVLFVARCFTRIQCESRLGALSERIRQWRSAMEAAEETSW
jgi:hypothetical protein